MAVSREADRRRVRASHVLAVLAAVAVVAAVRGSVMATLVGVGGAGIVLAGLARRSESAVVFGGAALFAATVLAAAYLSGIADPAILLGATGVFVYLMITSIEYPELTDRDALAMGAVQFGAVLAPTLGPRVLPRALLAAALAYLLLAPLFYAPEGRAD